MTNKEEVSAFSETIENLVTTKNITYFDAILLHCEKSGLEPEVAAKLISTPIKSKLTQEARSLNYLRPDTAQKLPIKRHTG
jgi:hypothetical protein